ncbi:MAG TPA: hypothetical protein VHC49_08240 [Mycobacteriales bacterium]|nr:hypothetical protein [Mycobacteriales bacterium]
MLHPVGGLPPRTYWRRRAMLCGAVLISAALIKAELFGGSSDAATRSSPPRPVLPPSATSSSATPSSATPSSIPPARTAPVAAPPTSVTTSPPLPAPPPTCAESALRLRVAAGAATYRLGELPVVRFLVTNRSARICRRDLGPALQEALVYDHTRRLWSSNDCWPGVEHRVVTLRPGRPESFSMRWSRTSSLPGCAGIRRVVPAGTYTLVGRVGGLIARAPLDLS